MPTSSSLPFLLAGSIDSPVYAGAWSPESDQVLYASSGVLHLKPMQPTVKPSQWRAHDGMVLAVDWSLATGLIVSGGEDRRYKVWDVFGRVLYTSLSHDCPVASVSWSPDGIELPTLSRYVVSSYNVF